MTKEEYNKMTADIESARMFDGRGRGVDIYTCQECGEHFYTRYKDKGVTPFTIRCGNKACHGTMVHKDTVSEECAEREGFIVHSWVRPTFEQLQGLGDGAVEHVLNGGLILEDELN